MASWTSPWWLLGWMIFRHSALLQTLAETSPGAYFLPEFALSPQGSFLEDTTGEQFLTYRYDDQTSRNMPAKEDKDGNWDAWGDWSDCSRTCGGGASYSLRRCLSGRNCEGQNIRYKTCSNHDCPPDTEDFRAQQCSAYNDVQYQGHYYEWLPRYNDPAAPCALKCHARGQTLVVELAPKVLDGTRCHSNSLDMCISGICQAVGCDRQLGSRAKEDNCGLCAGNGSTCRLVRGQTKSHVSPEKREENVIAVPLGSRSVRITVKGPAHLFIESKTLQGSKGEHSFNSPGIFIAENTTVEFQRGPDRQIFKIPGPLMADFIFKARFTVARDSTVQFFFYQPISHQWRQTDFFPCTVTCGGGYQLNSAECMDTRLKRVVPDHYCHYYPENIKPKPKLKECGMDPCPSSDGFKEIMPYDHFQPLPRWEHNPWTACSVSCGGGTQRRSFVCVEESLHGEILQVEEWKCMYAPRPKVMQTCNLFHCPKWVAMDWSQCTVTCGRGLRYRVVLCINHHGQHVGGCNPQLKLHIKEECIIPIPCYKPKEKSPVEAKLPWLKQARELEETRVATAEPMFIPEPWSPCSAPCGPGVQVREVRCRVLLTFTETETELPAEECQGPPPPTRRACLLHACDQIPATLAPGTSLPVKDSELTYHWEYAGFTPCTATCLGGHQEAIAVCLHIQTRQTVNASLCDALHRPPTMSQTCNTEPCPPRWHTGSWGPCSATCGVGIQTRDVYCLHPGKTPAPAEECRDDRPHTLQACNQFDCPPSWHIEGWQQCPKTCGGGTQHRRVTCRQLLTDGSFLGLSDVLCQGPKPSSRKSCARTDCPPHLSVGNWSECSVSCGAGTQRRKQVCQRLTAKGRRVPVNTALCWELPGPPLVRPCQMPACSKRREETQTTPREQGPQILAIQRVYIQTREEKRVHLTVGGRAYLLPNTSVLIRCPVRRFQKALIQWEKDGRCLKPSRRRGVTKSGSLKIHSLASPSDGGVYSCVAGPAREALVLKLIGTDNRLIAPPAPGERAWGPPAPGHGLSGSLGTTWQTMRQTWKKRHELDRGAEGLGRRPPLLRAVLGPCHLGAGHPGAWVELKGKPLDAAGKQGAYSMDTAQFDELIRNMSHLMEAGQLSDDLASQLLYQLVAEFATAQPAVRPWRATPKEAPPLAQGRGDTRGRAPQSPTGKHEGRLTFKPKGPELVKRRQPTSVSFNATVQATVGSVVYFTNRTTAIHLRCELYSPGEVAYAWTRDGMPLQPSPKIILSRTGVLQIRNPTRREQGVYGCSMANRLGPNMERSPVLFAEAPVILVTKRNVTGRDPGPLSIVVGGTVRAALGANMTIQCPVRGIPRPTVSWVKRGRPLGDNISVFPNGSLLLQNVSLQNKGTYVCRATSALGKAEATSVLHLLEPAWRPGNWTPCSATCGRSGARVRRLRCVAAGGQDVSEALCGHLWRPPAHRQPCPRQDCPPRWFSSPWSECSASCGKGSRVRQVTCQRTKASGSAWVMPARACDPNNRPPGRRPCSGHPCAMEPAGQGEWKREAETERNINVREKERHIDWLHPASTQMRARAGEKPATVCLGRCLGRAVRIQPRPVRCLHNSLDPRCEDRRFASDRNCLAGGCDACWRPGLWRPCSAACGQGIQARRVDCVHASSCKLLAKRHCLQSQKPASWRPCAGPSCNPAHPFQEPAQTPLTTARV